MWTFTLLGILAILAGGILSAFSAKKPSRQTAWASAYLVLVVGLAQAVIGIILYAINTDSAFWVVLAFVAYNLGNASVLVGTIGRYRNKSYRKLVDIGGVLLVISMIALLVAVHRAAMSWQLVVLYVIMLTIIVTMPIGLILSHRRKLKR